MRVAFFTAGTAGAGHAVRGLAIGRALRRAGFHGTYRMFGPQQPHGVAADDAWESIDIRADHLRSAETARKTVLAERLAAFQPDLLVVDMFWAPLRHVLPLEGCEAWLLLRSFPGVWLDGPPGLPFAATQYARVVAIEAVTAPAITHTIDPVVIANPDECRPRGALRRRLGIGDDDDLVVAMHAGNPGEMGILQRSVSRAATATFDLHAPGALFPICEWLGDCDVLHSGAGYNSFWEAHWLGYASRTRFVPFARTNDDQRWRLAHGRTPQSNGADTLAQWVVTKGGRAAT